MFRANSDFSKGRHLTIFRFFKGVCEVFSKNNNLIFSIQSHSKPIRKYFSNRNPNNPHTMAYGNKLSDLIKNGCFEIILSFNF